MKTQRGVVRYRDRDDIIVTYIVTDDGQQYYFLDADAKGLSNGNHIATTVLVEAVDPMVKATNIGVIDQNGVIVVPFENRSIRLANDNVLIVEKAVPTGQSVLDAIELRNDPTAATQLVSTPATIKDRLKAQMGVEGNYLFNDQFSEATICDINGTNLVQGESYSFISLANNCLYLSKNTADSPISVFSLTTYELVDPQSVEVATPAIDVSTATVDPSVVEGALASETVAVQPDVPDVPVDGMVTDTPAVPVDIPEVPAEGMSTDTSAAPVDVPLVPAEGMSTDTSAAPVDVPLVPAEGIVTDTPAASVDVPEVPAEGIVTDTPDASVDAPLVPAEGIVTDTPAASVDVPEVPVNGMTTDPSEIPVDANEESADKTDGNDEMPVDTPSSNESDTSISDDLKAFAGGIPSDDEEKTDAEDEVPPIVEEENADAANGQETTNNDGASESDTTDSVPTHITDNSSSDQPVEEAFSSSVTSSEDDDDEDDYSFKGNGTAPVTIDPETVLKTVDRDGNGVIDSGELMVPQYDRRSAPISESHSLTSLYDSPLKDEPTGYGYGSYNSTYTTPVNYDSYGSMLTDVKPDRISYDSYGFADNDNIMVDVAKSMSGLMKQNKEQRGVISQIQSQMDSLASQNRDLSMRNEMLAGKLRTSEELASRAEGRIQLLENKVSELKKVVAYQDQELKGKKELVGLLADARTLLGSGSEYDDGYYGRRAA